MRLAVILLLALAVLAALWAAAVDFGWVSDDNPHPFGWLAVSAAAFAAAHLLKEKP